MCWHAERELVLMKLRAPPGPARTEVMQLVDVFRANVVDVSEKTLTIAVTGDAGKVRHLSMWFLTQSSRIADQDLRFLCC